MALVGLPDLTQFITWYKPQYTEQVSLRNCPLVIDGCALMEYFYFRGQNVDDGCNAEDQTGGLSVEVGLPNAHWFGGDWETYARNVRNFFKQLKQCDITPFVLMDGSYSHETMKVLNTYHAITIFYNVTDEGFPGTSYRPMLLKTVFLEILAELKVNCYQTMDTPDRTIPFIAHLLGDCYFLSSNVYHLLYVNSKAIRFQSVEFTKAIPGTAKEIEMKRKTGAIPKKVWAMQGECMSIHRLCDEEFKLKDRRLLPLAAALLGNDYIWKKVFTALQTIGVKPMDCPQSDQVDEIAILMTWLAQQQSLEGGIEWIMSHISQSKKVKCIRNINQIIDMYEGRNGECEVWIALKNDYNVSKWMTKEGRKDELLVGFRMVPEEDFRLYLLTTGAIKRGDDLIEDDFRPLIPIVGYQLCLNNLSKWFIDAYTSCKLQPYILNMYKYFVVVFSPQVEHLESESCHKLSSSIIKVTAGLMFSFDVRFKLLNRLQGSYHETYLVPLTTMRFFDGKLPSMSSEGFVDEYFWRKLNLLVNVNEIGGERLSAPKQLKLAIMEEALFGDKLHRRNYLHQWPASYSIWMGCLIHYVDQKSRNEAFQWKEVMAMTCSIFLCLLKDLLINARKLKGSSSIQGDNPNYSIYQKAMKNPEKLNKVKAFFKKYEDYSEVNEEKFRETYSIKVAHALSEYMCLVFHTDMLNSFIDRPYQSVCVSSTINNFLMYNLASTLMNLFLPLEGPFENFTEIFFSLCEVEELYPMVEQFLYLCANVL